jgi:hypothetical protein
MGDEGTGGDGTFTQDQVNSMIAAEKRNLTAKYEEEKSGLAKQLEDALKDSESHKGLAMQSSERVEQMQKDIDERDHSLLRMRVGVEKSLPLPIIERLQGDDEASITADAEKLAELMKQPKGEGRLPAPKGEPETETGMNDLIRKATGRA